MNFQPKTRSLLILAAAAVACSRAIFVFFNDPEGPNLVVVLGLAIFIYLLGLAFYLSDAGRKVANLPSLHVAILAQVIGGAGVYLMMR